MMHQAPKPLLAAVDGRSIGGGMGLACACDWVVATERATFALPELLWGLMPAIIWPVLTDRMAPHVVRHWTLCAHSRSALEDMRPAWSTFSSQTGSSIAGSNRATRTLRRVAPDALSRLPRMGARGAAA